MKLSDCEITHRCMRGTNIAFIYGDRSLTAAEAAALGAEYAEAYGPWKTPAYVSPDGWQLLEAVAPAVIAEAPALAPAAPAKRTKAAAT